ncbi:hypothetical protein [Helicobacter sp. 23-1045]
MRKIFMTFGIFVAIFFSACAEVSTKSVFEDIRFKPKISINSVKLKSINLDSLVLESNITIDNFLPLSVNIKDAMINIYYEDKIINSYKISDKTTLKSRSKSNINLDSDIRINDLVKMIKDYTTRDSLPFKVEVATMIFVPNNAKVLSEITQSDTLFEYNLKERFEIEIPTINPKISLKEANLGIDGAKVVVNVKNNTKAKFSLENISYKLRLAGLDFNGDAKSTKQSDDSVDIIMDNFNFSLPKDSVKSTGVDINANLQLGDLPYKIPLKLQKDFK